MKLIYPTAGARNFYERNSLPFIDGATLAALGPHANTTRMFYSTPPSRRTLITNIFMMLTRATAAPAALEYGLKLELEVDSISYFIAACVSTNNVIATVTFANVPTQIWLHENCALSMFSKDLNAGGTVEYAFSITGITFDV